MRDRAYVASRKEWEWEEMMKKPWKRGSMRSKETVKAMHDGSPWLFEKSPFQLISMKRSFVEQVKEVPGSKLRVDRKRVF